jgi:hypothetical protein
VCVCLYVRCWRVGVVCGLPWLFVCGGTDGPLLTAHRSFLLFRSRAFLRAPPKKMAEVLHTYQATEQEELSIAAGEQIEILKEDAGSGWTYGRNARGDTGLFPQGYFRML